LIAVVVVGTIENVADVAGIADVADVVIDICLLKIVTGIDLVAPLGVTG
jgi:hypothetical protein